MPLYWSDSTGGRYLARDESGRLCATRMTIAVAAICFSDVLFAMDSVPVVLSLTTSPFLLVTSQAMSLLWLRPVYFLLAALASYLDSMQQALAVVLVLIASKIFLESAGVEVPLALFLGVSARRDSTRLDATRLDSTRLDSTRLDSRARPRQTSKPSLSLRAARE